MYSLLWILILLHRCPSLIASIQHYHLFEFIHYTFLCIVTISDIQDPLNKFWDLIQYKDVVLPV